MTVELKDFYEVLEEIRQSSKSEYEKGIRFEDLMVEFFTKDPLYKERFKSVTRWDNWDHKYGKELGVDLVAEEVDGGYCGIQCKFYHKDNKILKRHLDSFISQSSRYFDAPDKKGDIKYQKMISRIFIHTAEDFSDNAVEICKGQKPRVQIMTSGYLASRDVHWPSLNEAPGKLKSTSEKKELRKDQKEAFESVVSRFRGTHEGDNDTIEKGKVYNRGKMVMACGTGKTFTSLKIAEEIAGVGGSVLYLVPSISLLQQTMREWVEQKHIDHSYVGICSDQKAGKNDENENLFELEIPVTTQKEKISEALKEASAGKMRVVFCTYQSIDKVIEAQKIDGTPEFDIAICDEAHRTTGLEDLRGEKEVSSFSKIHNPKNIRAKKRLYMTATPRVYAQEKIKEASNLEIGVFSMDDENTYGPLFYELDFAEAIDKNLLSDYEVVILKVDEDKAKEIMSDKTIVNIINNLKLTANDAAKIIGSAKALAHPDYDEDGNPKPNQTPLKRTIAFCNTIAYSKGVSEAFLEVTKALKEKEKGEYDSINYECHHVDGTKNAVYRKDEIEWLKKESSDDQGIATSKILSNARCLTEGIDIPALDAAIFLSPKSSYIDVIQAVGRVMRKSPGKKCGYVILPIVVSSELKGEDIMREIDKNEQYKVVWRVLQALRSHDKRLDRDINSGNLERIRVASAHQKVLTDGGDGAINEIDNAIQERILEVELVQFKDAIYTHIIEKVGDRKYWPEWAKDVAEIAQKLIKQIKSLLDNEDVAKEFDSFLKDLQKVVSPALEKADAIGMLAQHQITAPVFKALFSDYDFVAKNPVSQAMKIIVEKLEKYGLAQEAKHLDRFYESVRYRASGVTDPAQRQDLIRELYDSFFQTAFPEEAARLGVVYTPTEIVDYMLRSVNDVLKEEFGKTISDKGINIIEPFAGTGTFMTRLIQSDLIKDDDLERKFKNELHANELLLLPYYISTVNIEEAYYSRRKDEGYKPFEGIVLRDTFRAVSGSGDEQTALIPNEYFKNTHKRAKRQDESKIQVIITNPPWSAGQKSIVDENPNDRHEELENRIRDTYIKKSKNINTNSLYDSYIKAIRWASDRIGDDGIVSMITNNGWIDSRSASGMRYCLADEFSRIYVYNFRGNRRKNYQIEGTSVFTTVQAGATLFLLIKNKEKITGKCQIYYKDIGDNLKGEKKLEMLAEQKCIEGTKGWELIEPDDNNDWTNQRKPSFQEYLSIGNLDVKNGKSTDAIFLSYSLGVKTNRDAWAYNSSRTELIARAKAGTNFYNKQIAEGKIDSPEKNLKSFKWTRVSKKGLKREKYADFDDTKIRQTQYRPFLRQWLHYDSQFNEEHYRIDKIFPTPTTKNLITNIPGKGSNLFSTIATKMISDLNGKKEGGTKLLEDLSTLQFQNLAIVLSGKGENSFSALVTKMTSDLHFQPSGQLFPRFQYKKIEEESKGGIFETPVDVPEGYMLDDNILDEALDMYQAHYNDKKITKDGIFFYVYGLLHSKQYRKKYANDLVKDLPRIPMAPDFWAFSKAGEELCWMHVDYEKLDGFRLKMDTSKFFDTDNDKHWRFDKLKWGNKEKTSLIVNEYITVLEIPPEAHKYIVNGKSALGWIQNRYQKTINKESGIENDANNFFEDPRDLIKLIEQVTELSLKTLEIVNNLPKEFE